MELMKISQDGVDLIKKYEGCKLTAYQDSVNVWTIGWGNTSHAKAGMVITQQMAEQFLKEDLEHVEKQINAMKINFKQNQFDALCSFVFNLGIGNFNKSTLKKYILGNLNDELIAEQFTKWFNAGGKPLLGLKYRRRDEANMWLGREVYYVDCSLNIKKKY